jgi:hypothetical protein
VKATAGAGRAILQGVQKEIILTFFRNHMSEGYDIE